MNKNIPDHYRDAFRLKEDHRKFVRLMESIRKIGSYTQTAAVLYPHEYEACLNNEFCRASLIGHPVFVYNPNTFEFELKHEKFPD